MIIVSYQNVDVSKKIHDWIYSEIITIIKRAYANCQKETQEKPLTALYK